VNKLDDGVLPTVSGAEGRSSARRILLFTEWGPAEALPAPGEVVVGGGDRV
jgi:hypothetical protein